LDLSTFEPTAVDNQGPAQNLSNLPNGIRHHLTHPKVLRHLQHLNPPPGEVMLKARMCGWLCSHNFVVLRAFIILICIALSGFLGWLWVKVNPGN
jgi:hypothetical protein